MKLRCLLAIAAVFLTNSMACRNAGGPVPPRLPPAAAGKTVETSAPGEFLFADAFDGGRSFVRLTYEQWQPPKSNGFRLEGTDPAAVTQAVDGTPLPEASFVLYFDEKPACTFVARSFFAVYRVMLHSGQHEEMGLSAPDNAQQEMKPNFAGIVAQAAVHLGVLAQGCPAPANRTDFVWAHPKGREPQLWHRLPDEDPQAVSVRRQVQERAMQLPFGAQSADYLREMPNGGPVDARTAVFVSPDGQQYRVEDYRRIGETMCGGTGFEQWSFWTVRDGEIQLLKSGAQYRRVRLVLDVDADGEPEFVAEETPFMSHRIVYRCKNGRCVPWREDKYPFNECPC